MAGDGGVRFRVLGPVEIQHGEQVVTVAGPRQRAVLAALVVHAGAAVTVARLVDAVWDVPPSAPESNVRTYVAGLRRRLLAIGVDRLDSGPGGYRLRISQAESDVGEFAALGQAAATALREGEYTDALALALRASALWRGDPLNGGVVGQSLQAEIGRWQDMRLAVAETAAHARIRLGDAETAVADLRGLVAEFPLREELWLWLIRALHRSGRQADALAAYADVRRLLDEELGVEPGPALRQVHRDVLAAVEPQGAADCEAGAWRQLPMDIAEFTGREAQLRALADAVDAERRRTPVIAVIEGMGGVGKTRLAVHFAHLVSDRFDEVQLWSDLHGFGGDQPPADPAAVLENFLRLLGVPGDQVPHDLQSRAVLYRDRLAGRRAVVLLDNAATEEQVRPLLPGTPESLVLVTTRRSFTKLDGARSVHLDVLTAEESRTVLSLVVDDGRIDSDPDAAARIAALCGHLPLAVTLVARRLRRRPRWSAGTLVDRLERSRARLDDLFGDPPPLRTAFDLSYRTLSPAQQGMFRMAGLHPGEEFTAQSAAALCGVTVREAEELLEGLLDEHLLQQTTAERYRFHDLIGDYARARGEADEQAADREAARRRVLVWYLHAAEAARTVLDPHRIRLMELPALPGDCAVPWFADHAQALRWFEAERATLLAAVRAAHDHGPPEVAWQLPWVLLSFYYRRSHWDDWVAAYRLGLAAARAAGARREEGIMFRGLGVAYSDLRRFAASVDCHQRAQEALVEVGDLHGQAWNLNSLGVVHVDLGRLPEAADCFRRALPLFRRTGDPQGEGFCLNNLGDTWRRLGEHARAVACLEEALALQRGADDRIGLQFTLATLGDIHRDRGDYAMAVPHYREALAISRALGDQRSLARTLAGLADTLTRAGEPAAALPHWREAHAIFTALGDPQARAIHRRLPGD
ncbi:AfsR/SARP family transcriptional regulator [Actinokineospora fastidiosa]|uniref:SARP family transcriptional regulator n=1 Tax=Actinokineospora fastidiosa TaxID=1816 RepID=A0A918LH89_9PSEU|nr:AfsR/SARP family transcriptional regulator [Actinokineospora fastidiosa]GGS46354.1 SARP family transcriptional regulator [Actinokineospora fastidiosa]